MPIVRTASKEFGADRSAELAAAFLHAFGGGVWPGLIAAVVNAGRRLVIHKKVAAV